MLTRVFKGRDVISLLDFSKQEMEQILDTALELKRERAMGRTHHLLDGKTLFMIFFNPSTRTRNSFEAGIFQLGGHAHFLQPSATRIPSLKGDDVAYKTERISDMARVLSRMGDAIAIRILGDVVDWEYDKGLRIIREFAEWADIPVFNMEDNIFHPFQGLADMMTIWEMLGRDLHGRKIGVTWTYSASTKKPIAPHHTFLYGASLLGADIVYAKPPELRIDEEIEAAVKRSAEQHGGSYTTSDRMEDAFEEADIVYGKNHVCLDLLPPVAPEPRHEEMGKLFSKYEDWIVDDQRLDLGKKHVQYMHCLPCERGMEVTEEVMDGTRAAVFQEAENRLHAQKAAMALTMQ
jgi:N-acetylornithine carbamoyltransferase